MKVEKQSLFLQSLHTKVLLTYFLLLMLLALAFQHPACLGAFSLALIFYFKETGLLEEWLKTLPPLLFLSGTLMGVNLLFVRAGQTLLFVGTRSWPLIGTLRITLESLVFALMTAWRLILFYSVFHLWTRLVRPDRLYALAKSTQGKLLLILNLSLRLFPLMKESHQRIKEGQRCRGVDFERGSLLQRLHRQLPIFQLMLLEALDRAFLLAESLEVRGFGSGPRQSYETQIWRPRDGLMLGFLGLLSLMTLFLLIRGYGGYQYYPRLEPLEHQDLIWGSLLLVWMLAPTMAEWGWDKWPGWKSKI